MPSHLVRSAVLTGYAEVARSLGLEPYRMLDVVGLPAACLTELETRISADAASRLLEVSAAAAGVEDFALRLLSTRQLSLLGLVGLVVREQPTVGKAIEAIARYVRVHNEAVFVELEPVEDGLHILKVSFLQERHAAARQGAELLVGASYRILKALLGDAWVPQTVCFTHGSPRSLEAHHRAFGPDVEFDHEFNGVLLTDANLAHPLANADPLMAEHLTRYIDQVARVPDETTADQVRRLMRDLLASGQCSADRVARRLGVDRRTVHDRLVREGVNFSGLLDDTRRRLASAHLEDSERSIAAIAEVLGFSATSAFTRWFRVQFDATPTGWRRSRRGPRRDLHVSAHARGPQSTADCRGS